MNQILKFYAATAQAVGSTGLSEKRQVHVVVSTSDVDRDGEIIVPEGISWKSYMASGAGTVLWNHNSNMPVAKCIALERQANGLHALVQFPPEGEDREADTVYTRVKFGSVSGVSIGFLPLASEPLDRGNPKKGPQRYTACDMMEFSFTPVPSNPSAIVVDKTAGATTQQARERCLREIEVLKLAHPTWGVGREQRLQEVERLRLGS